MGKNEVNFGRAGYADIHECRKSLADTHTPEEIIANLHHVGMTVVDGKVNIDGIEDTIRTKSGLVDSGQRTEFESGAMREQIAGKGRFDLIPLDIMGTVIRDNVYLELGRFVETLKVEHLYDALSAAIGGEFHMKDRAIDSPYDMMMKLAKHFENGAVKYEPDNWKKGLPLHTYIDSASRHWCKHKLKWNDEPHLIACIWNIVCCIYSVEHNLSKW